MRIFALAFVACLLISEAGSAQTRLAITRQDGGAPITWQHCSDFVLALNPIWLIGSYVDGTRWHFTVTCAGTDPVCCPSCEYDLTLWFKRPYIDDCELLIGHLTRDTQTASLAGNDWTAPSCYGGTKVWEPTDFTHLYVEFVPRNGDCPELFFIPIEWSTDIVPTEGQSWGGVKSQYKTREKSQ